MLMKKFLLILLLSLATATSFAQTWTLTSAPSTNWSCVASSADGSKLVAAVTNGFIYTSTNSGLTWAQTSAPNNWWTSLASSADGSILLAVSPYDFIYRSTNAGAAWEPTLQDPLWIGVACSADGRKVAASGFYTVAVSTNSGAGWTRLGPDAYPTLLRITSLCSSADGNALAVIETSGFGSPASINTTPASTWVDHQTAFFMGQRWTSLAMAADGTRIVASANNVFEPPPTNCGGMLYISSNSGATVITNCTTVTNWTSVASSAEGTRLVAVAGSGDIYRSTDAGTNWEPVTAPNANWSGVASSADGCKLVAVANGGGIYTWQTTPTPALNITPVGNGFLVSWVIPSMNFRLQENPDLRTTNWTDVAAMPVLNFTNLQNQVTLPLGSTNRFYRVNSSGN
jgi:photosystem II stability/assembly factor-like uncharacterized protein